MEESIKHKTIVSTVWASIQHFGRMGIAFVANIILARLLLPEDYGTIGMLAIFIAVSSVFVDSGLGNALIQRKEASGVDYSTIFFFNLGMSAILYLALCFAAPAIARFYNTDILTPLIRIYGLVLIINSLSLIQSTRFRKQLNFKTPSIIVIIANIVSALVGIYMAYNEYGVWSLVVMQLVEAAVRTALLWFYCKWLPQFTFSLRSLFSLFKYGGFLLANSLLFTLRQNILSMVLGKLYTVRDLGMYTQAKKLEDVPVTGISSIIEQVSFPVLAKLQDDKEHFQQMQRRSLKMLAFLCIPLMFLMIVIAKPLILVLYTDKWIDAAPYLQVLCLMGIVVCLQVVNANVVNAKGYSGLFFRWSVIKTIIMFISIWLGHYWGIMGLLWSLVLYHFLAYIINAILATRFTSYTVWLQFKDLLPIGLVSTVIAVVVWLIQFVIHGAFALLVTQSIVYILLFICAYYLIDKSMLVEVLSMIRRKNH